MFKFFKKPKPKKIYLATITIRTIIGAIRSEEKDFRAFDSEEKAIKYLESWGLKKNEKKPAIGWTKTIIRNKKGSQGFVYNLKVE